MYAFPLPAFRWFRPVLFNVCYAGHELVISNSSSVKYARGAMIFAPLKTWSTIPQWAWAERALEYYAHYTSHRSSAFILRLEAAASIVSVSILEL